MYVTIAQKVLQQRNKMYGILNGNKDKQHKQRERDNFSHRNLDWQSCRQKKSRA